MRTARTADGETIDLSQARFRRRSGRRRTYAFAAEGRPAPAAPLQGRNGPLRILGIDTALRTTGYGILDVETDSYKVVDGGLIKTNARQPFSECLRRLTAGIRELAKQYAPDVVAIEGAFYFENARTAMALGAARGAVIATLADMAIPMYEYAPRRVKQAVCGHGNASKQQVTLMVSKLLAIEVDAVHDDTTDALALAICHAQTASSMQGLTLPQPL